MALFSNKTRYFSALLYMIYSRENTCSKERDMITDEVQRGSLLTFCSHGTPLSMADLCGSRDGGRVDRKTGNPFVISLLEIFFLESSPEI